MQETSIEVNLSTSLRDYCGEKGTVRVDAGTIREALHQLQKDFPSLYTSICDETGSVRRHINLFVNSKIVPVRDPQGYESAIEPGDVLTIFTSVSGG